LIHFLSLGTLLSTLKHWQTNSWGIQSGQILFIFINWSNCNFLSLFKGTPSQEEHKTILHSLIIIKMTLTWQSHFNWFSNSVRWLYWFTTSSYYDKTGCIRCITWLYAVAFEKSSSLNHYSDLSESADCAKSSNKPTILLLTCQQKTSFNSH